MHELSATRGQLRAIDRIYADLPTISCRGKCQAYCGVVLMSEPEWARIVTALGYVPEGDESLSCPMLCKSTGRCTVYSIRPIICRLWGLVKALACPHGCKPNRWLTERETRDILGKVERIGATPYRKDGDR
jgi:Fe-S-cluster containining protein